MKKNIYLIFTFFIASICFAQQCPKLNKKRVKSVKNRHDWEIGVNLFSLTNYQPSLAFNDSRYFKFNSHTFPGVFYKLHKDRYTFRTSFELNNSYIQGKSDFYNLEYFHRRSTGELKVGLEKIFKRKKISAFLSSDICLSYSKHSSTVYKFVNNEFVADISNYFSQTGFATSIGLGGKYNIYKNINLIFETSVQLNIGGNNGFERNYYFDGYGTDYFLFKINPIRQLGISFNY